MISICFKYLQTQKSCSSHRPREKRQRAVISECGCARGSPVGTSQRGQDGAGIPRSWIPTLFHPTLWNRHAENVYLQDLGRFPAAHLSVFSPDAYVEILTPT